MTVGVRWFDPDGNEITEDQWWHLLQSGTGWWVTDHTPNGNVLTHYYGRVFDSDTDTAPAIYETSIDGGPCDGDGDGYPTKAAAMAGHARWVETLLNHDSGES